MWRSARGGIATAPTTAITVWNRTLPSMSLPLPAKVVSIRSARSGRSARAASSPAAPLLTRAARPAAAKRRSTSPTASPSRIREVAEVPARSQVSGSSGSLRTTSLVS